MRIKLETIKDLEQVMGLAKWLHRPKIDRVDVGLPWLSLEQRHKAQKRLKSLFNDCGCLWGGPIFLVVLVIRITMIWDMGVSLPGVAVALAMALCAAVLAKFLALCCSFWRLKSMLSRLMASCPVQDRR